MECKCAFETVRIWKTKMQKLASVDVTFGIYKETYSHSLISDYEK